MPQPSSFHMSGFGPFKLPQLGGLPQPGDAAPAQDTHDAAVTTEAVPPVRPAPAETAVAEPVLGDAIPDAPAEPDDSAAAQEAGPDVPIEPQPEAVEASQEQRKEDNPEMFNPFATLAKSAPPTPKSGDLQPPSKEQDMARLGHEIAELESEKADIARLLEAKPIAERRQLYVETTTRMHDIQAAIDAKTAERKTIFSSIEGRKIHPAHERRVEALKRAQVCEEAFKAGVRRLHVDYEMYCMALSEAHATNEDYQGLCAKIGHNGFGLPNDVNRKYVQQTVDAFPEELRKQASGMNFQHRRMQERNARDLRG